MPGQEPLLVILDDAHLRAEDAGRFFKLAQWSDRSVKVLLLLRPYGEPQIRRSLQSVDIYDGDILSLEVPDLQYQDALTLASQALSEEVRRFAPQLANAAYDCPLLIVLGARQINDGLLDPQAFERDETLRSTLENHLTEALVAGNIGVDPGALGVLTAVAAYQPVP